MFVFLHENSAALLEDPDRLASLKTLLTKERIMCSRFAPGIASACAAFRDMCLSLPDSTFSDAPVDGLQEALEETYSLLMNGCVISYQLPPDAEAGSVTLKVSSSVGCRPSGHSVGRRCPVTAAGSAEASRRGSMSASTQPLLNFIAASFLISREASCASRRTSAAASCAPCFNFCPASRVSCFNSWPVSRNFRLASSLSRRVQALERPQSKITNPTRQKVSVHECRTLSRRTLLP